MNGGMKGVGRKKKDQRKRTLSVAVPHLHLALLDYLVERLGKTTMTRSIVVRRAIEDYAMAQEFWNSKDFTQYSNVYKEEGVPDGEDQRAFTDDVTRFTNRSAYRSDSDTLGSVVDLDVASSKAIFKY